MGSIALETHPFSLRPHPLVVALRLHHQLLPLPHQSLFRDFVHPLDDGELLKPADKFLGLLEHLVGSGHVEVASGVDDPLRDFWIFSVDPDFLPLPDVKVVPLGHQE